MKTHLQRDKENGITYEVSKAKDCNNVVRDCECFIYLQAGYCCNDCRFPKPQKRTAITTDFQINERKKK